MQGSEQPSALHAAQLPCCPDTDCHLILPHSPPLWGTAIIPYVSPLPFTIHCSRINQRRHVHIVQVAQARPSPHQASNHHCHLARLLPFVLKQKLTLPLFSTQQPLLCPLILPSPFPCLSPSSTIIPSCRSHCCRLVYHRLNYHAAPFKQQHHRQRQ
jgi:hypothetical protein